MGIQGYVAYPFRLQGCIHLSGATDELVELECKGRISLGRPDCQSSSKEGFQGITSCLKLNPCVSSQAVSRFREAEGSGPPRLGEIGHINAKAELHPDG